VKPKKEFGRVNGCTRCGRRSGIIRSYGMHRCREGFWEIAPDLGFKKYSCGDKMQSDPLNDAMSVMKNASSNGKSECVIQPSSKLIGRVLKVMQDHGYINQFEYVEDGKAGEFRVMLKGAINNCGVIKPRYSVKKDDLGKYEARFLPAQDFGLLIITTTAGVVTQDRAKELGIGGKLIAFVY
jgi:small subunit ribosomal protein S8